jgi:phage terminase Nu1 subunit (DNA packaging protein)
MADPVSLSSVGRLRKANKAEVAEFFDVSIKAVDGWVRRGCPVVERGRLNVPWVFDLLDVAIWRITGQRTDADVDPDTLPPSERKAWYEGETRKRELQVRDRELIPAAEVEQAIATAFAAIAQDMRAIPDNLERRHGIDPQTAEQVEAALLQAMDSLADRLAALAPVEAEE